MSGLELYERRTYDVHVGQMNKVLELYSNEGWPALEAGGHSRFLVGYFVSDTGHRTPAPTNPSVAFQ